MNYISEIEYAAQNLIALISHEEASLEKLKNELKEEEQKFRVNQWDFVTSDLSDDFSDAYVQAAFGRMAHAHQQTETLKVGMAKLQVSIGTHQVSIQAMSAALLQIAKQGISIVHGALNNAPDGRMLSGIALKEIIWQGRNQALHHEEGKFGPPVTALFGRLEAAFGNSFSLTAHAKQSRATQVVHLLEWTTYDKFKSDLQSLGL